MGESKTERGFARLLRVLRRPSAEPVSAPHGRQSRSAAEAQRFAERVDQVCAEVARRVAAAERRRAGVEARNRIERPDIDALERDVAGRHRNDCEMEDAAYDALNAAPDLIAYIRYLEARLARSDYLISSLRAGEAIPAAAPDEVEEEQHG